MIAQVTFTASAPAHFADLSAGTQVTEDFDVYMLIYKRVLTLDRHQNYFNKIEDESAGTLMVAAP